MIKLFYTSLFCLFSAFSLFSQTTDTIVDADGNIYTSVTIGNQVWMTENLKTTKYNDSTLIPKITDSKSWITLDTGAYTCYENNPEYYNTYGALYNWYAVNTQKLCPTGWHVPSDDEWNSLEISLGMNSNESAYISYRRTSKGAKLKTTGTMQDKTGLWHTPNEGATNESEFSALPGGFVYYNDGNSYGMGSYGFWWSSSAEYGKKAWYRLLYFHSAYMSRNTYNKGYGFSVRCIKD